MLTVDLEKQAAELQEDDLPVATPIISIPHISARWCAHRIVIFHFTDNCTFSDGEWQWLTLCKFFTGCITTSRWLLCGCCVLVCTDGWCACGGQWSEWAVSDLSVPAWPSSARATHTHSLFPCSKESSQHLPKYAFRIYLFFQIWPACVYFFLSKGT